MRSVARATAPPIPRGAIAYFARPDALFWAALAFALIGVKLALLAVDPVPRLFMGDSGSYLWSAVSGAVPSDRSFTYGRLIPLLALGTGDLRVVLASQAVLSAASAWLLAVALVVGFGAGRALAAGAAFAVAIEPLQLAYERFVMTETVAMLPLAGIVVLGLFYLRRPRAWLLAAIALIGVPLISLRLNLVPVAWGLAVLLPVLAWSGVRGAAALRRMALHGAIALAATAGAHAGYWQIFGWMSGGPPAYQHATGLFALAAWAPLVERKHFVDPELADWVLSQVTYDLRDPSTRESQRWEPTGLVRVLEGEVGGEREANRIASGIVRRIALSDPLGVVRIGIGTLASFFHVASLKAGLDYDLGPKTLPGGLDGVLPFSRAIGPEAVGPSLIRAWHTAALPWYGVVLLCPLWALAGAFATPAKGRWRFLFLAALAAALIATGPFLATMAVVRYLHPLAWITVLVAAALLQQWVNRRNLLATPKEPSSEQLGPCRGLHRGGGIA
jgi:hypothetical protein